MQNMLAVLLFFRAELLLYAICTFCISIFVCVGGRNRNRNGATFFLYEPEDSDSDSDPDSLSK